MTVISFLCFLLLIFIFTSQANTRRTTQNFLYFCVGGNYTTNSTYQTNLNTLLSNLTSNTEIDYGFYNSSYGENSDRVNAIGMCRGDIVNLNTCRSCLSGSIANLTQLCPNRKEAIGWYANEICMLRYSNRSIFGPSEIGPAYYQWNLRNATNRDEFNKEVKKLLDSLKNKAASGDSRRKYDAASAIGPNDQTIYGLVQCTPDFSAQQCDDCLAESITEIPNCCNNAIGARILRPSCILRYQTNSLFYEPSTTDSPSPSTLPPSPSTPFAQNTSSQGKSNNTATGIGIAIAVSVVVAIMVLIFICIYLKVRKSTKKFETQEEDDKDDEIEISESLQFKFNTIQSATNDFSDSNKLGQGGFGAVYRGSLSNGQEIAVKRLSRDSGQGDLEFKNEVLLVAKLQHRNLVRLLGFCLEGRERLLVYEFVPNKSLEVDNFIFDQTKRAQLNWEMRYKIIADIARGILYLHEDSRLRIIHRDLKASNILLDEKMHPKIADFGMARLFGVDQTQENTNRIVGTYGYMAPEYAMHGQFSVKSDVFSFGILVLEIISGHKNSVIRRGENIEYLPSFAWRNWREGSATNIMDPTLNNGSLNEVLRCIHIGLLCVQENVASRPTMASVVVMLNSHSVTLPIPSEPAFYLDSRSGSLLDMQSWGANSAQDQSVNEASITELYPR